MANISSISSNFFKKPFLLYSSTKPFHTLSIPLFNIARSFGPLFASLLDRVLAHDPSGMPEISKPGFTAPPPLHNPGMLPELPQITNVLELDTIPPEKPADPPPLSPGPNPGPEFPSPPTPSPPMPEGPKPPMPSPPGEPEAFPPDVTPPKPPEPGLPHLINPDSAPPFMGSDGLVFSVER
ncbi:hypothetical protein DH2020_019891 [Rehmannia glutinosa]|uniref:Uncharacterized protein n=1 Tax=Rehmannia glutinosa TaxID=99300 RepID=A0ABR0WIE7_REHGL